MVFGLAEVMTGAGLCAYATAARQTREKKSRISLIVIGSRGVKSPIQRRDRGLLAIIGHAIHGDSARGTTVRTHAEMDPGGGVRASGGAADGGGDCLPGL